MFMIGIAGGSGSGKTTFAKKILALVEQKLTPAESSTLALIHQDSYYLSKPAEHLRVQGEPNFDHPEAFDWPLFVDHLSKIKTHQGVDVPIYDYRCNQRTQEVVTLRPTRALILEGIYALWHPQVKELFDLKIYLNVEADIRFIRRLHRDAQERDRTLDSIIRQYYDSVRPMHHAYIEPTRQCADLIIGEETDVAAEVIAARVLETITAGSFAAADLCAVRPLAPQQDTPQ